MANTRQKITRTMPSFAKSAIQIRTLENWAKSVASVSLLEERIALSLNQWLDARDEEKVHFAFQADTARFIPILLDDIQAIVGTRPIRTEFTQGENFMMNGSGMDEILRVTGSDLGNGHMSLPLLLIATHKVFVRRQIGWLWNRNFNITMSGCVNTTVAMGVAVLSEKES
jgi:hypothetical protein